MGGAGLFGELGAILAVDGQRTVGVERLGNETRAIDTVHAFDLGAVASIVGVDLETPVALRIREDRSIGSVDPHAKVRGVLISIVLRPPGKIVGKIDLVALGLRKRRPPRSTGLPGAWGFGFQRSDTGCNGHTITVSPFCRVATAFPDPGRPWNTCAPGPLPARAIA